MDPHLFNGLVKSRIEFWEEISNKTSLEKLNLELQKLTNMNNLLRAVIQDNNYCLCKKCHLVFSNDLALFGHICTGIQNSDQIPSQAEGKFECPNCNKKYVTEFLLGEHFILAHNDYEILRSLDNINHTGFPGFDLLFKINMFEKNNSSSDCGICFKKIQKNLIMTCCKNKICKNCLKNHVSISDSIVCPFCSLDHTKLDLDYLIIIEPGDKTDRNKWIPWWNNHLDIFNY